MSTRGADGSELIKWWSVFDMLYAHCIDKALQTARECRHPDAEWLASLFPAEGEVALECFVDVMRRQGTDARAFYMAWLTNDPHGDLRGLLEQAAEMGYAPAQASLSAHPLRKGLKMTPDDKATGFRLAERAAAQGDRRGLFRLGERFWRGDGCERNVGKAVELLREAAELDDPAAQGLYGEVAFGALDWERFYWWGRAALQGRKKQSFCIDALRLLPSFEKGELGRILHTVAPVVRKIFDVAKKVPGRDELSKFAPMLELHEAMVKRARQAIDCWAVAGRRGGLVRDVRVMIAKLAWEPWVWFVERHAEHAEAADGKTAK
jgi:hypothetical protein